MALGGKLVRQVDIKSDGNAFHELFRYKPYELSTISPGNVQGCDLHEGEWGTVGSVIYSNYTHDGKKVVLKLVVEAIDEEKKSISFKAIEGDLMQLYKSIMITVQVDTTGDNNFVMWTLDYEKLDESVEDPITLMDLAIEVTKHIETHHLK